MSSGLFGANTFAGNINNNQNEGSSQEGEEPMAEEDLMENVRVTYQVFVQNNLDATCHSLQWLPNTTQDPDFANFERHNFLIGTDRDKSIEDQSPDEIIVSSIRLPKLVKNNKATIDCSVLDASSHSKFQVTKKLVHEDCEVIKVRACPADLNLLASMQTSGVVNLYNLDQKKQVGMLTGLEAESFSLSWSQMENHKLISCAEAKVQIWDAQTQKSLFRIDNSEKNPEINFNDAQFSPLQSELIIAGSSDGHFQIFDVRQAPSSGPIQIGEASNKEVNVATFNNTNENLFAIAGDEDGTVSIYDQRMPGSVLNDLQHHTKEVTNLIWHPYREQILLSAGEDGKVFLWDNSKCGEEQARKDYEDGPPELVFPHLHHSSLIEDVQWQPTVQTSDSTEKLDLPMIASVENQFCVQIWKPLDDFFAEEIDMLGFADNIPIEDLE